MPAPFMVRAETIEGRPLGLARMAVALAVPAIDDKDSKPVLNGYVLLPTRDVVKGPLEDLAKAFGLAIFDGVKGDRFGVNPGAVVRVSGPEGLIGQCIMDINVPNVVPSVAVIATVDEAMARFEATKSEDYTPAPPASRLVV